MIKQIIIELNPFFALFPYERQGRDISYNDGSDGKIKKYSWLIFSIEITFKNKKCK